MEGNLGLQRALQPMKGGSEEGRCSGSAVGGGEGTLCGWGRWFAPAGTRCVPDPAGCSERLGRTLAQSPWSPLFGYQGRGVETWLVPETAPLGGCFLRLSSAALQPNPCHLGL